MEIVQIGNATLYHGDSLQVLPLLNNGEVDSVISDPPYATERFGGKCTACDWDVPFSLTDFWEFIGCKSKPSANVVLFCNMKFAFDLIASNRRGFRYDLVWEKSNRVGFFNANLQPLRAHENILVFGRPNHQKTATYNAIKTPSGRPRVSRNKAVKGGGVYSSSQKAYTSVSDGTRNPISVLAFSHIRSGSQTEEYLHPTQKPILLLNHLLEMYSNPGDTVLDMFMGSGTTGEAALMLNRNFIGIEREKKFFDIACKRLEEAQRQKALCKPQIEGDSSDAEQTDEEWTIPSALESESELEYQDCEDTNHTEDLSCQE
jgi:site-specific DNA-methyltransferase (adenine-specific)